MKVTVDKTTRFGDKNVMVKEEVVNIEHPSDYLTLKGAQRFAITYERAERECINLNYLNMLAYNLGMRGINETGSIQEYAPRLHEDILGGTLPGELVMIETTGWKYEEKPIIRAKVLRLNRP